MTVREATEKLSKEINGVIHVYNVRTKMYESHKNDINDEEVKKIRYHRGYGYNQINAVIEICKKR